ncbi:hypothetical protein QR680_010069 [Steinernema hermaphroditum]|uniref:Partial AB-hydrolase lipase domain-containing protein n=1 Tax=Steinernema hermaphroditum TaxID=289476 RepID=A0AA39MB34_9BILA|nr:hypothetical protein QR680_010069 [Steinernema hermaphroditum]
MRGLVLLCLAAAVFGHDPEADMSTPEIINRWGYPAEIYTTTTEDGYVLELHRIPFGKAGPTNGTRPVVFMQHGLECSSTNWVANLPNESAGFLFADAGYDVWLGNMRGNRYSKAHTTLDPKKKEFWQFTWDEMSHYDLQAMIEKALNVTGQEDLYYMGHSQGTLTMFAKLSRDPVFAKKIRKFFALAPVGTVKYIKGLLEYVAKYLYFEIEVVDYFGDGEFLPSNWLTKIIADWVCGSWGSKLCDNVMFLIAGPESHQLNQTRTDVYVGHTPSGTSTNNILHWAQMVKSGKVEMYDYRSAKKNQEHYGMSSPPEYDFTLINIPMYLYWSDADWLGDGKDVTEYLIPNLNPRHNSPPLYDFKKIQTPMYLWWSDADSLSDKKDVVEFLLPTLKQSSHLVQANYLEDFNHLDYIWGLRAAKEIYEPVLKLIGEDLETRHSGNATELIF